ncbi:hypothetical protein Hanom_Chr00s002904g01706771 [Helianthus anomalus]
MARIFLETEVSDLCVGKPPLRWLPATATVADAVAALKRSGDINVSVWNCNHHDVVLCRCIGKICMVDVIDYVCKEDNPFESSLLDLLPKVDDGRIKHLEANSSLMQKCCRNLTVYVKLNRMYRNRSGFLVT